ncbi:putative protein DUF1835 [Leeuwenhoekiella aestuarii]|uniref:DUF1835 domain-containing protein n=1 Tax=Leeuwenhoekiella aestuarii TaxID=2249426 RepID=A0A4Q0NRY2_9FLAO|nr:DUF1835 domain-containing protein [Leeuwenhoekiella aestuarii]RXG13406.1 putative protein DUF1835 [Leeuwenhoekiella aestuarii]RXG14863.1 putative protein DUF1835 [Leeuwenhoekiella aestuarii]
MGSNMLHITNGDSLTKRLDSLELDGDLVIWREMLCEGPTLKEVGSQAFIDARKTFLKDTYNIPAADYENKFVSELKKLSEINMYDEVILWFEFDLFCHINMLAAISYLIQHKNTMPIYIVCSGWVKGEAQLKGLSELTDEQLLTHYEKKIQLAPEDLKIAHHIWQLYCDEKPIELKAEIKNSSNFKYLSSCIRAHIERFPNKDTGLNSLETNILKLIDLYDINSVKQLCGYALNYQGYYGYGDLQFNRMIKALKPFFRMKDGQLILNTKGKNVLDGSENYYDTLKDNSSYGGTHKYSFLYNPASHELIKHS